jgi:hypothetical protein
MGSMRWMSTLCWIQYNLTQVLTYFCDHLSQIDELVGLPRKTLTTILQIVRMS